MTEKSTRTVVTEIAARIREMRGIFGYSTAEMAERTQLSEMQYIDYESGAADFPFTFIHNCALIFNVELTELLEGRTANLTNYSVTRKGGGQVTAREQGIEISNLAPEFRQKIAQPYSVRYEYSEEQQSRPIKLSTHSGQEFDYILKGKLKVQVGKHTEILCEGDSIYYDSSTPHGMIAVGGEDCIFCAVILPGEASEAEKGMEPVPVLHHIDTTLYKKFVETVEDSSGALQQISFKNADKFNFAFDVVDALGVTKPDKLAMLHLDSNKTERRFTFREMMRMSSRAANYFKAMGIKRGDRVMIVLRRNYQFWPIIVALHKLGAIAVPATDQLMENDFIYRFNAIDVSAIICTADGRASEEAEKALASSPTVNLKIIVNGARDGWREYDSESMLYRSVYERKDDSPCGDDYMLMYFTSGTTGHPKVVAHSYKYALGHFITAKYWHCVDPDGIHFTISDTGWGKSVWGKLYGQWLCEAAIFTYDFDRFDASDILSMFGKYGITTFCAPPTMYRFMIKEDLSKFDLSSIKYATTAGEALNPEVFKQFKKATGLSIMEGFGQTETTLSIANLVGMIPRLGSMGKPSPLYEVVLLDREGKIAPIGETGEICIRTPEDLPCGLFAGYYLNEELTKEAWHDGFYHTGDLAWQDEDGYLWFVGRADDVIKSSGYRIGPFEIESVIMELPFILECAVSAEPDEIRGQIVKASVILTKGTVGTEELKKEIQKYVKAHTAPYKYPRIVVFREELPKTISGKIQRYKL